MVKISETIIVEGKYDKIKVETIFDTTIISTDGFDIFKNKEKLNLIRKLAQKNGIIILTDSDGAGLVIRNYLLSTIDNKHIKNAYIPQKEGKEKRKLKPSKEGFLGVEGIDNDVIKNAITSANCTAVTSQNMQEITKLDLYNDQVLGAVNSKQKRQKLLQNLDLPKNLSTNALLSVLNTLYTYQEYKRIIKTEQKH